MSLIAWAVSAILIGFMTKFLFPKSSGSIISLIVKSLEGAFIVGFTANILYGIDMSSFNLPSTLTALFGSLLMLYIKVTSFSHKNTRRSWKQKIERYIQSNIYRQRNKRISIIRISL